MLYQFQSERKTRRSRRPVAGRCGPKVTVKMESGIGNCSWVADKGDSGKRSDINEGSGSIAICHHGGSRNSGALKCWGTNDHANSIHSNPDDGCADKRAASIAGVVLPHNTAKYSVDVDNEGVGSGVDDGDFSSLFKVPRSQLLHDTPTNSFEKFKNTLETYEYNGIIDDPLTTPKLYLPCKSSADYSSYCYSNDYYEVSLVSNTEASLMEEHESPLQNPLSLRREMTTTSVGMYDDEDDDKDDDKDDDENSEGRGLCCTKSESIFSRNTSFDSSLSSQYFAPSESTYSSIASPSSIDSDMIESLYDLPTYTYELNPIFKSSHQNQLQSHPHLFDEVETSQNRLLSTSFSLSPTPINVIQDDEDYLFGLKPEVPSLLSLTNSNRIQSYVCTLENTIDDENNLNENIFPPKPLPFTHVHIGENIATNLKLKTTAKAEKKEGRLWTETVKEKKRKVEDVKAEKSLSCFTSTVYGTKDDSFLNAKKTTSIHRRCNHSGSDCQGGSEISEADNKVSVEESKKPGKLAFFDENKRFLDDNGKGSGNGKEKKSKAVVSGSKVGKGSKRGRKTRGRRPWTRRKNDAELGVAIRGSGINEITQCKENSGIAANAGGETCEAKAQKNASFVGGGAVTVTAVTTTSRPGRRSKKRKQPTVFICKHCGKDFPRKSNHDSHIRLHLTVKPHVCQFCSKAFVRRSDMNRHERSLHLKTTFKCFGKCNRQKWGCGHLYSRKDGLRKHWKSAQGQECLREFMVLNNLTEQYHEVKDLEKIIELTHLF